MRSDSQEKTEAQATLVRLVEQYQPALWRLVNFYEPDPASREDLFQEVLLGLWRAIPRFRGDSSERTWLYRIAHNIAISQLDSRLRKQRAEVPMPETLDAPAIGDGADDALVESERRRAMLAGIRELGAIDRQIIVLHLEGLSHREIEQVSGLSQNAITTRLSRIRARLTNAIQKKEVRK
jgi:RNA polymerase sigma-70 factor (ECF subfamily)